MTTYAFHTVCESTGHVDIVEPFSWRSAKREYKASWRLFKDQAVVGKLGYSYVFDGELYTVFVIDNDTGLIISPEDLGLTINEGII